MLRMNVHGCRAARSRLSSAVGSKNATGGRQLAKSSATCRLAEIQRDLGFISGAAGQALLSQPIKNPLRDVADRMFNAAPRGAAGVEKWQRLFTSLPPAGHV